MPYYNLDHLDAVTRLIADLGISVDDDGHVGDDGSTYYGGFIQKGGETLSFTVRQPQGAGKPDAVEAMRQLVEEACLADRGIDTLAGERGITKPSQAVYRFDRAKQALDFLNDRCYLGRSDLLELHSTLGDHLDAVRKGVAAEAAERAEEQERTHPKVPEGFVTIESLQDDLDTGDWGKTIVRTSASTSPSNPSRTRACTPSPRSWPKVWTASTTAGRTALTAST